MLVETINWVLAWAILRVFFYNFIFPPNCTNCQLVHIGEAILSIVFPLIAVINLICFHSATFRDITVEFAQRFDRPGGNRADRDILTRLLQRTGIRGRALDESDQAVQRPLEPLLAEQTKSYLGRQRVLWQSLLESTKRELSLLEGQSLQCEDLLESKKKQLEATEKSVAAYGGLGEPLDSPMLLWRDILETKKGELVLIERQRLQYQDLLENKKTELVATEILVRAWISVIEKEDW